MRRSLLALVLALAAAPAWARDCGVEAVGGVGICGDANGATITLNTPPEKIEELVRQRTKPLEERTAEQKLLIALLQDKLDLNAAQIRAALQILDEADTPPERLAAKLVEVAQRYKALRDNAASQPGDDAASEALKRDAQAAIEGGDLAKADSLLAEVETTQKAALARLAANAAATAAKRGEIAMTRLRYTEAAGHFADAAAALAGDAERDLERIKYLMSEARALLLQGDEFNDKSALAAAAERWRYLATRRPREKTPLDWARIQKELGDTLKILGERESATGRLDEAVSAYRAALEEVSPARAPLDWAATQDGLGNALERLGERESGTKRLDEAVTAYRAALQEESRERTPLNWAVTQNNLGGALLTLGQRKSGTGLLADAVAAFRAAAQVYRTESRINMWAQTQINVGGALKILGEREGGTDRLDESVIAYRASLQELLRERAPLDWAFSQHGLANALDVLAERRHDPRLRAEALAAMRGAAEVYRQGGVTRWLSFAERRIAEMEAELAKGGAK